MAEIPSDFTNEEIADIFGEFMEQLKDMRFS